MLSAVVVSLSVAIVMPLLPDRFAREGEGVHPRSRHRVAYPILGHFQKLLNLVADNSVYLVVWVIETWPSHAWIARVSCPALAKA